MSPPPRAAPVAARPAHPSPAFPTLRRCAAAGANAGPRPGGYSPVPLPDAEVSQLAGQALQTYLRKSQSATGAPAPEVAGCQPDAAAPSARVLEACSQVVAGSNFYITFQADIPCTAPAAAAPRNRQPVVEGAVFVPLPYTNELPSIKILRAAEAR